MVRFLVVAVYFVVDLGRPGVVLYSHSRGLWCYCDAPAGHNVRSFSLYRARGPATTGFTLPIAYAQGDHVIFSYNWIVFVCQLRCAHRMHRGDGACGPGRVLTTEIECVPWCGPWCLLNYVHCFLCAHTRVSLFFFLCFFYFPVFTSFRLSYPNAVMYIPWMRGCTYTTLYTLFPTQYNTFTTFPSHAV